MDTNQYFEIPTSRHELLTDMNTQAFDPTENTSLWSKWRTAVNAQLYNKSRISQERRQVRGFSNSLTEAPLKEYLQVSTKTRKMAHVMMTPADFTNKGKLRTEQFIYYGIPRMVVKDGEATARDRNSLLFIPKKKETKYKMHDLMY